MPVTNSASDRSQRCNTGGAARPLFFFQSQPHATDHSSEHRCRRANSRSAGNAIQGNATAVCGTACLRHAVHCGRPSAVQIGGASRREKGGKYGEHSLVGGPLKKKQYNDKK